MRKSMVAFGLALALTAGSAGLAAAQGVQGAPQRPQHEQADGRGEHGRRGRPGAALLRGISLSDAQKAQLKQFREAQRSKFKSQREQHQADFKKVRDARQRGDTATANAMMRQFRAQMEQQRDAQVAAIRGILTPDQQKQFDANLAQWKQREAQRDANGRRGAWRGEGHGQRRGAGSQG